jgi:hypothetical protein
MMRRFGVLATLFGQVTVGEDGVVRATEPIPLPTEGPG